MFRLQRHTSPTARSLPRSPRAPYYSTDCLTDPSSSGHRYARDVPVRSMADLRLVSYFQTAFNSLVELFRVQIDGPAGSGKSSSLTRSLSILTAAFGISGHTIHFAFRIRVGRQFAPLDDATCKKLKDDDASVHLIIDQRYSQIRNSKRPFEDIFIMQLMISLRKKRDISLQFILNELLDNAVSDRSCDLLASRCIYLLSTREIHDFGEAVRIYNSAGGPVQRLTPEDG
ncbi:hypothetical protein KCU91_g17, partial [Aureobasidium melanogenum]